LLGIAFILILGRLDLRFRHGQQKLILSDCFYGLAFLTGVALSSVDTVQWRNGIFAANLDFGNLQWNVADEIKVPVLKVGSLLKDEAD
jgi:hypothetical protein